MRRSSASRWLLVGGVALLAFYLAQDRMLPTNERLRSTGGIQEIEEAFQNRRGGFFVESAGTVTRMLPDDDEGSRHQRFVLELSNGQTVLVSHNIDLAPRVPAARGERIEFRGEYEWNERGGVIHWTHHDPGGRSPGGWLRHQGRTYR